MSYEEMLATLACVLSLLNTLLLTLHIMGVIQMIETETITKYYCDDCGERINSKSEPNQYLFRDAKTSLMLCNECKEKLKKWLKDE